MAETFIRRSGADYAEAFEGLLPVGAAWPRDPDEALMQIVSGLGQIWGQVDGRAYDLLKVETDPRYADEMLSDWERALGLPDGCIPAPTTIQGRRDALIAKLTATGGQSRPFFKALALSLGYDIEIVEWSPFQFGTSRFGDTRPHTGGYDWFRFGRSRFGRSHLNLPGNLAITGPMRWRLGPPAMRARWRVLVKGRTTTWFRFGRSRFGDRLLKITPPYDWFRFGVSRFDRPILKVDRARDLECLFNRYKPAHSVVRFDYSGWSASAF